MKSHDRKTMKLFLLTSIMSKIQGISKKSMMIWRIQMPSKKEKFLKKIKNLTKKKFNRSPELLAIIKRWMLLLFPSLTFQLPEESYPSNLFQVFLE